jgi:transposase
LRRDVYRKQRRHDGFFVLKTNHLGLSPEAILDANLQLQEIERCFRLIKARLKLRPIYHYSQRRVETHIFLVYLAFLIAKSLVWKLEAAGLNASVAWALEQLSRLRAIEHTWEGQAIVAQATRPDAELETVLLALGIKLQHQVLRVSVAARPPSVG